MSLWKKERKKEWQKESVRSIKDEKKKQQKTNNNNIYFLQSYSHFHRKEKLLEELLIIVLYWFIYLQVYISIICLSHSPTQLPLVGLTWILDSRLQLPINSILWLLQPWSSLIPN